MSISDIVMCVSESSWATGGCSGAEVHLHWWGWINLTKRWRRGRNIISQCATVEVPDQRGGNVTMCAVITHNGVIHHHATHDPCNIAHLTTSLDTYTTYTTHRPTRSDKRLWAAQLCCHLGQCRFLVHCTPTLFSCLSPSIFSIPQSYWGNSFLPGGGKHMTEI